MPKISKQRLAARKRGIVQAAARYLQRNGLEGTGMRDLFRAANLSPGAVYRYFSSKEELVAAVAAASPSIAQATLSASERAREPIDRLRSLLAAAVAGPPSARLQFELQAAALHSPGVAAALAERRVADRQALAAALTGPNDPPPAELVDLVLTVCEGLARARLIDPKADVDGQALAAERMLASALAQGGRSDRAPS